MGDHYGLGLSLPECGLQLVCTNVAGGRIVINEDGDRSILKNRGNGRGKSCGHRDHLVTGLDSLVSRELVRGQCGESHQIRRGTRVHEKRVFDSQKSSQFFFEGLSLRSKRQPEIQRASDGRLDLIFGKNAASVGNNGLPRNKGCTVCVGTRSLSCVGAYGILTGKPQDFLFELGKGFIHQDRRFLP